MDKKDLYREIGNIDDDLILEAQEKKKLAAMKKIFAMKKIVGVAACFAIAVGLYYGLNYPKNIVVDKTQGISKDGYTLTLNEAKGQEDYSIHIEGHFWAKLTEAETTSIYGGLGNKYPIEAVVDYSKQGENISVFQARAEVQVKDEIVAKVTIAPEKVTKCYVLESEPILSEIKGVTVNAGYFDKTNNEKIIYYADFKIEDIAYYIEFSGEKGDEELLYELIYEIISGGKADFSVLKPIPPKELRNDIITLEEAYADKDFGGFIPRNFPSKYAFNEVNRFINQEANYLMVYLSEGDNNIMWNVSFIKEADKNRITSVDDRENYDVKLYPIPTADSVPKELMEIVDNPIFLIEELTLETVKMRTYRLNEQNDTNGEIIRFSVLYGDVLVEVNTNGVTAEEVYNMVISLK